MVRVDLEFVFILAGLSLQYLVTTVYGDPAQMALTTEGDEGTLATYLLVHGAWHGSWCWKRVRQRLLAAGHSVFTPTLTGLGERSHLNSSAINLSTHIADIVNLVRWEGLSNVILCGHSYGGCVISGAAEQLGELVSSLVYIDAYVLQDGESLLDLFPVEQVEEARRMVQSTGEGWKISPLPAAVFNVDPNDSEWVDAQCTPQPLASFEEPIVLTRGAAPVRGGMYILATNYGEPFPMTASRDRAKKKGLRCESLPCGHEVMLDLPNELTDLLLQYA
jgi:pimeloyl-ACP methyl ester carboxylesterase